jgi:hypothetical protein
MCGHQLSISFTPLNEERARQLVEGHESNIEIDETALDIIVDQRMVKESRDASSVTDVTSYLPGYGRCISQGSSQNTMYVAKRNDVLLMDYHVILILYILR